MTIDNLPELHGEAATAFADLVSGVRADQWSDPTPCDGWSVRDLVNHVVTGNLWVVELVGGATIDEVGNRLDGDNLGADPSTASRAAAEAAATAFRADGAMASMCAVSYGPVPGEIYCGHRLIDLVGHTWDLATATGRDQTLPPDLVAAAIALIEPQFELLVASGQFGDASDPGDSIEPQERLLRMLGR
jgi:uncharacterized protein (TIGR03086 family)